MFESCSFQGGEVLPGQKFLKKINKKAKFNKSFDFERKTGNTFFSFVTHIKGRNSNI